MTSPTVLARVVVGCDGSPGSDAALRFAATEASLRHAQLSVVVAYDQPVDPDSADLDADEAVVRDRAREQATASVRRALMPSEGQLPDHQLIVEPGDPAHVLLQHSSGALMVVVGVHDQPLVQRLLARQTTRRLLHRSAVPVVAVPATFIG